MRTEKSKVPQVVSARVSGALLAVSLSDGRIVSVPLSWYPRLQHGSRAERAKYEIMGAGIHWPELDEDISVEGVLAGRRSVESAASLKFWLARRGKGEKATLLDLVATRRKTKRVAKSN